jgi:hypothetical protein
MRFDDWSRGRPLSRPVEVFDEANRVAAHVARRWGRS